MRSLATISSGGGTPGTPSTPSMSYISRTFPRAMRGSSSSVAVTRRDATSAWRSDDFALLRPRSLARSGDLVEPGDDLVGVTDVVGVVEDRVQVQRARAPVGGEQLAQRDALVPRALRELLDDAVGLVARGSRLDERVQH